MRTFGGLLLFLVASLLILTSTPANACPTCDVFELWNKTCSMPCTHCCSPCFYCAYCCDRFGIGCENCGIALFTSDGEIGLEGGSPALATTGANVNNCPAGAAPEEMMVLQMRP